MIFTIIVPCYNAGKTLHRALESLCVQNHLIKQVLLIDDGSTDNTHAVAETFQTRLPLSYHYQANQGPSVARNLGLDLATGDYIVFLDADDALTPHVLVEYEHQFLQMPEVGLIIGGARAIHEDRTVIKYPPVMRGSGAEVLLDYWFGDLSIGIDSCAMRATAVKEARFPVSIKHGEDIVFFSHLLTHTMMVTMATIPVDVYHHADSLRHQNASFFKEADTMIDLLFDPTVLPAHVLAYRNQYHAKRLRSMASRAVKAEQKDLAKAWITQAIELDYRILFQVKTLKILWRIYL